MGAWMICMSLKHDFRDVTHRHKNLLIKTHLKPRNADGQIVDEDGNPVVEESGDADDAQQDTDYVVSRRKPAQPSWAKRFEAKLKKIFCLQVDNQKRMYEAHVYAKKSVVR